MKAVPVTGGTWGFALHLFLKHSLVGEVFLWLRPAQKLVKIWGNILQPFVNWTDILNLDICSWFSTISWDWVEELGSLTCFVCAFYSLVTDWQSSHGASPSLQSKALLRLPKAQSNHCRLYLISTASTLPKKLCRTWNTEALHTMLSKIIP